MYGHGSGIELTEFTWKVGLLGFICFGLWILLIALDDYLTRKKHGTPKS